MGLVAPACQRQGRGEEQAAGEQAKGRRQETVCEGAADNAIVHDSRTNMTRTDSTVKQDGGPCRWLSPLSMSRFGVDKCSKLKKIELNNFATLKSATTQVASFRAMPELAPAAKLEVPYTEDTGELY